MYVYVCRHHTCYKCGYRMHKLLLLHSRAPTPEELQLGITAAYVPDEYNKKLYKVQCYHLVT